SSTGQSEDQTTPPFRVLEVKQERPNDEGPGREQDRIVIKLYRVPYRVRREQVNSHDEHGTSFTDCKAGDPPHCVSCDRNVKGGKGREYQEVYRNELI